MRTYLEQQPVGGIRRALNANADKPDRNPTDIDPFNRMLPAFGVRELILTSFEKQSGAVDDGTVSTDVKPLKMNTSSLNVVSLGDQRIFTYVEPLFIVHHNPSMVSFATIPTSSVPFELIICSVRMVQRDRSVRKLVYSYISQL